MASQTAAVSPVGLESERDAIVREEQAISGSPAPETPTAPEERVAAATATPLTTTPAGTSPQPQIVPMKRSLSNETDGTGGLEQQPQSPDLAGSGISAYASPYRTLPKMKEKVPQREGGAREKKDSQKKRDAQNALSGATLSATKLQKQPDPLEPPKLMRYRVPQEPRNADYDAVKMPTWVPVNYSSVNTFYELTENPTNRKGYRYFPCVPTKILSTLKYHATELPPYNVRISFEDKSSHVHIDGSGTAVTTEKGFRLARANVGVREGDWYYECKVLSGIGGGAGVNGEDGHVRIGWARREASVEAPIGFDAYGYGLRDVDGQAVHISRPKDFMKESFVTGDVLGLHISLPVLESQRAIVNPAYASKYPPDVLRDRLPIKYKSQFYFEQLEYVPTKEMEDLLNPANSPLSSVQDQEDDQKKVQYRTLPGSSIRVYKNGEFKGVAFENLFVFLPPASQAMSSAGGRAVDDGACGYFPAVSVFRGGCVQMNFGPTWEYPPPDLVFSDAEIGGENVSQMNMRRCRPMSERYNEEIAEDITHDIIDELDVWSSPAPNILGVPQASGAIASPDDRMIIVADNTDDMEVQQSAYELGDPSAVVPQPPAEEPPSENKQTAMDDG